MSAAFALNLNLKRTMCVTDMLDDCFPGTRGEEMVGEIQSKAEQKSKSMRVITARHRNMIGSMKT